MTARGAIGELAIADSETDGAVPIPAGETAFDWFATVISQYANSPIMLALIESTNDAIDPAPLFDMFYTLIWNIETAQGYGLDVLGRIVGIGRVLQVATGGYLGFKEATDAQTFGHGIFYSGTNLTSNFALSDTAYRRLILAKAYANISDGSIPSINQLLITLFPGYGNVYVADNLDMSVTFTFATPLSPVDAAIINQVGSFIKPAGVSFSVVD